MAFKKTVFSGLVNKLAIYCFSIKKNYKENTMSILLVSTAFSGLTQRFYTELDDAGYNVSVELHLGDKAKLIEGIGLFKPELIIFRI
jgi:hypothetical protein